MKALPDLIARARRSGALALRRARERYLSLMVPAPDGYGLSRAAAWRLAADDRATARKCYRKAARLARLRYPAGSVMRAGGMVRKPSGDWTPGPVSPLTSAPTSGMVGE